tara:strand:+ start:667 stop:1068 length:402 start_codon:yes stop_codon:yes gene_type:complete
MITTAGIGDYYSTGGQLVERHSDPGPFFSMKGDSIPGDYDPNSSSRLASSTIRNPRGNRTPQTKEGELEITIDLSFERRDITHTFTGAETADLKRQSGAKYAFELLGREVYVHLNGNDEVERVTYLRRSNIIA